MVVVAKALLHGFCHDDIPRKQLTQQAEVETPKTSTKLLVQFRNIHNGPLIPYPVKKKTLSAKQKSLAERSESSLNLGNLR